MLEPERGGLFVDATVGAGGHAESLLERGTEIRLLGIDRDPDALALARRTAGAFRGRASSSSPATSRTSTPCFPSSLRRPAFSRTSASRRCSSTGASAAFPSGGTDRSTCAWDEAAARRPTSSRRLRSMNSHGSSVIMGRSEWRRKIARGIVAERTRGPIQTTRQLARIVAGEKGSREKIDPATRVFQALRIEVNQELVALGRFLAAAVAAPEARRPARRHLVSLARGSHREGGLPARFGRLLLPAEAADLHLRRAGGLEAPDAAAHPAGRGGAAAQSALPQRAPSCRGEARRSLRRAFHRAVPNDGRRRLNE